MYVDDIVVASGDPALVSSTKDILQGHFKLKVLGNVNYFIGLEIAHSPRGIHLCQRKYALQLLEDTGFTAAKPLPIPTDPGIQLSDSAGDILPDAAEYRRLVGRLIYLTISRPDIAYCVNKLSQFMSQPRSPHLQAIHHLLRYIKGTTGQCLLFPSTSTLKLSAYVDSDWGSCVTTRRSTTGFCVYIWDML